MHSAGSAPAIDVETARYEERPRLFRLLSTLLFGKNAPGDAPSGASRSSYLPGLDGLRALSVIAVLIYHARPEWLPGGFLGVEVFFVISGFIITRGLLQEWHQNGRISLKSFWLRRARRLLPAVFLLLAGVLAYVAVFEADEVVRLREDILASLAYVMNWHLIIGDQSYFDSFQRPSMLRHLWSLAIEEQFYVVWPVILAFGLPLLKKNGLAVLIVGGITASAVGMALLYDPAGDNSRAYFGTDTRAAGLLVGALLAFIMASHRGRDFGPWGRRFSALLGVAAVAVLLEATFFLSEDRPFLYQGGFLAVSITSALAILAATQRSMFTTFLSLRPLRWIGLRSYGIYLWHWPVYMTIWPRQATLTEFALHVAITVVLAGVSYALIEQPIRGGALGRAWKALGSWSAQTWRYRGAIMFSGTATTAAVFSLVAVAVLAKPPELPAYFQTDSIQIRSAVIAEDAGSVVRGPTVLGHVQTTIAAITADDRTCPSDQLSPQGTPIGFASSPFGSTCPPALALFEKPPAAKNLDAPIIVQEPVPTEVEMAEIFAQIEPPPPPPTTDPEPTLNTPETPETPPADQPSQEPPPGQEQAPAAPPPPAQGLPPASVPSVTAIGDSVMLGAAYALAAAIPGIDLDASVGRQAPEAVSLLQYKVASGMLGQVVVLQIGNNGTLTAEQFDQMMGSIPADRTVIVLNLHVPRNWQDSNNAVIVNGAARWPNAILIDWYSAALTYPEVLHTDGIHLTPTGASYYAQLILAHLGG